MQAKIYYRKNILAHSPQLPVIVLGDTKYQVSFGGYMYSFSPCDIADPCINFDDLLINWHITSNRPSGMNIEVKNSTADIVENKRIAKVGNSYYFKINDVLHQIV